MKQASILLSILDLEKAWAGYALVNHILAIKIQMLL